MKTLLHLGAAAVLVVIDWVSGGPRPDTTRAPIVRFIVKHPWMTAAALAGIAAVAAAIVLVSGVVPIAASSGHWPVTARLLDFAKLQSVRTHAIGIRPPELDDEAIVLRGAAHYAIGCQPCHGGPGERVPPVMAAMTPPPPELTGSRLTRWSAPQLYSIVKDGIKFTGMPGWPFQQRDDEVWALVAFLRRMPDMAPVQYRRLAFGDPRASTDSGSDTSPIEQAPAPQAVRDLCWHCHGRDGTGRAGVIPSLAGQRAAYMYASLRAFADRTRFSGTMAAIASRLSDEAMRETAAYYERLPRRTPAVASDEGARSHGAIIATQGIPGRNIPACVECHGPADVPKNPAYPVLSGQHARYLTLQLNLLKERQRGGSPRVNIMHVVADRLAVTEMSDVAEYFAATSFTR